MRFLCTDSSVIWLTGQEYMSRLILIYMMILCFRVQHCWSERWIWRGKKETKDFDAYAQCVDTNDMKDGNENGKETQSTLFQAYALDTDVLVWKMGMRRKEETHTTSFQAYANLLGMSFPHWPSSEDTTYSQKNLRCNFLKLLFTSIAQKVFGVIMNIPITEIFASVFRRGISSYEHIDLSVVLDSGPKEASSCSLAFMLPNPYSSSLLPPLWCHSSWAARGR